MKFEHLALNVPDAREMARWYGIHLDLRVVRSNDEPPYVRFLSDSTGRLILELYTKEDLPRPDYRAMDPLTLHVAFATNDAGAAMRRLEAAGAATIHHRTLDDGTVMVMMRDPWGIPLQLCQRKIPF